ncbi:peptidase M48 Ste24p [Gloeomargarita lithophora Alchichica-D10]|uniref:Peptidase M48 Ste24p n=1 Tax=Gloeomargarita lithophora Alchichica-D10 TaxID=1188229 RepID=A0A1J0AFT5_9CYAN|nr:zinc metalloprotease HtpX [Gloeomargarita lithophora]APB34781.1 peptidase M48 Ste24p [Gloeomargarita lithophora Alchichica-D10]
MTSRTPIPLAAGVGSLVLASTVTLGLLLGMVLVLGLAVILILDSSHPALGFFAAIVITILFNAIVFFLSPYLMDWVQWGLYQTRWVSLTDIERQSRAAARIIRQVCAERGLKEPKLGLIDDQNPTAFTYGSLPNTARVVVSQGLFTYLEDEEAAAVYAHELGHVVHWDFAVMTLAQTLVQICYLLYIFLREMGSGDSDNKAASAARSAAVAAYIFYIIGTYLLLYLSRVREYFADHFAAETTGNPNALSQALVKIAYGIVEQSQKSEQPSRVLEGTRALGIFDPKAAGATGTIYASAGTGAVGRVFLWDLFNPWATWMELNSTHPLTGKRIRALTRYAEALGQPAAFDMAAIISEGRHLDQKRLYSTFILDIILYWAPWLGALVGLVVGLVAVGTLGEGYELLAVGLPLVGLGVGLLVKTWVMYPAFRQAPQMDVLTLMSDPYASPLRGKPARLAGQVIGRGNSGYIWGSEMQFQDKTGLMFLRYASRFGSIGNWLFGAKQVEDFIGQNGETLGWFRRGIASSMDMIHLRLGNRTVESFHRFWGMIWSVLLILVGAFFLLLGMAGSWV